MKNFFAIILVMLIMGLLPEQKSNACTNFLITKGATKDGSVMITYSADSHVLYGELYYWPSKNWPAGSMLDIYEWDTEIYGKNSTGISYLLRCRKHEPEPGFNR